MCYNEYNEKQSKAPLRGNEGRKNEGYEKKGYFTGWQWDDETFTSGHRIYYNDIDIATANLLCDGIVVGNIKMRCARMEEADKKNNYMW